VKRIILIILDSVGIGELPDSEQYGDKGSDTLGSIYKNVKNFSLKNMENLGLRSIRDTSIFSSEIIPHAAYGKMNEVSKGKDTTTGHWEIAGIHLNKPFPVYPDGFPENIIKEFENKTGRKILGNIVASGTEIIKRLGLEHVKTGYPIVYTSADSVFQIAAHEDIIPVKELYKMCETARAILTGENSVGRVIARPFTGNEGKYVRTTRRHDYSLSPTGKTVLDYLKENSYKVKGVGKIIDIFNNKGITDSVHTESNIDGIQKTLKYMDEDFEGLVFSNLVDFDMKYGHRNDIEGYASALKEFDDNLPIIKNKLKKDDILIITADHGCDPSTESTDHSREYVPLLVYRKNMETGIDLGIRKTFADIAKTIADYFGIINKLKGESFLKMIR
jgi:phosphopentomutase